MNPKFLLVFLMVLGTCAAAESAERHVVLITIDGFPSYLLDDPKASLPVIRGLARSGVAAEGGMRVSNPSVTWPNHTTLMTGVQPERHGVLFNGGLERQGEAMPIRVNPYKTQQDLVRIPLLFDILKEAGMTSAAINWPCTRNSPSLVDNFPDVPEELKHTSPRLRQELEEKGVLEKFEKGSGVDRDEVWTEAACHVIRERTPRLLVLHLLNLDSTHHRHGPLSPPGYAAVGLLDAQVGRVLAALDEAKVRDQTAVFVLADHGFAAVTKSICPNVVLRREGLLTVEDGKLASARVQVISEGGIGMVYLLNPETAAQDREAVRRLFRDAEGIEAIVEPADFPRYHLPQPGSHPGMADMILAARDGYSFSGAVTGDSLIEQRKSVGGSHGFLSTQPKMNAVFVASGSGIKTGSRLGTIDNADVAPTVARLLGVPLEDATGHVLTEILDVQD
jgi:predicted AlkP superfamily pyrophosphatase or phosphodiesterase